MDQKTSARDGQRILDLNDALRKTFVGGTVVVTAGVDALSADLKARVLGAVREFNEFSSDNDPHREHDFGAFELSGERFFWKIDYYNRGMDGGSENPADPEVTTRVLTIMLASEY